MVSMFKCPQCDSDFQPADPSNPDPYNRAPPCVKGHYRTCPACSGPLNVHLKCQNNSCLIDRSQPSILPVLSTHPVKENNPPKPVNLEETCNLKREKTRFQQWRLPKIG